MAQKQLAEHQIQLIERTKLAVKFHRELAELCDQAGLPVLAREHDHAARELDAGVGMRFEPSEMER